MRGLALLLLLFGPLLSAPAATALWAHTGLAGQPRADLNALAAAVGMLGLEAVLMRRPGLLREFMILVLSSFWAGWLWLGLTDPAYDWMRPPALRIPDGGERFVLILIVLVYLTLYALAVGSRPPGRADGPPIS